MRKETKRYLIDGRLADVLALIQVLALDEYSHRSDKGLSIELPSKPQSAAEWKDIAAEHPEFFRVSVKPDAKRRYALVARHVQPKDEDDPASKRQPLDTAFTGQLLKAAIDLHDRQERRAAQWQSTVPLWVAAFSAFATLGAVLLKGWIDKPSAPVTPAAAVAPAMQAKK